MKKWIPISIALLAALALVQVLVLRPDTRHAMEEVLHRAADASPRAGTAGADAKVSILVVSDATGSPPVRGARLEGQGVHEKTGLDGRATLPNAGSLLLRVLAAGFVGRQLTVDLSLPDQTIVLKRTGSARFAAVDSEDKPVEGLAIQVSVVDPEPSHILPGADPVKTSGPDGLIHWADFAPGAKVEWSCVSGHPMVGDTPAEGTFTVAGGETYTRTLKVRRTSMVRARLPVGADASGVARVEVWNSDGAERQIEVPVGGTISIASLEPGRKTLRAAWWDAPGRRVYARVDFDLAPGESRDLGTLPKLGGESLSVKPELRGPLEAAQRLEKPARMTLFVRSEGMADQFDFEYGATIVLSGLPPKATVSMIPDFKFAAGAGVVEVQAPPQVEVVLPHPGLLTIAIRIDVKFPASLTLNFTGLARQTSFAGILLSDFGGSAIRFGDAGPPAGATSVQFDLTAPPGTYKVLIRAQEDLNLFATGTLKIGRDGVVTSEIGELRPGAILRGRAVTKSGEPWRQAVSFAPAKGMNDGMLYTATPDGDGGFVIGGIEPNTRITTLTFKPDTILVGDAGTETRVELKEVLGP